MSHCEAEQLDTCVDGGCPQIDETQSSYNFIPIAKGQPTSSPRTMLDVVDVKALVAAAQEKNKKAGVTEDEAVAAAAIHPRAPMEAASLRSSRHEDQCESALVRPAGRRGRGGNQCKRCRRPTTNVDGVRRYMLHS